MHKSLKSLLFFLGFSSAAFGVAEYYSVARSVRALGMGGAFYSLSDDEYALFYNPAGLSLYRAGSQFLPVNMVAGMSTNGSSEINTLTNATKGTKDVSVVVSRLTEIQGKPLGVNAGMLPCYVGHGFGIGVLLADTKANLALLGKELDSYLDLTAISDSGIVVGTAGSLFSKNLHFGLNSKFLVRAGGRKSFDIADVAAKSSINVSASSLGGIGAGVDFDAGMIYSLPKPLVGSFQGFSLTLSNLLATRFSLISFEGGLPPGLVRTASLGAYVVFQGGSVFRDISLRLEAAELPLGGEQDIDLGARGGNFFKHVNMGMELPTWGWLFFRGGIHQGWPTAGIGFALPVMRVDFAYYREELSTGIDRLPNDRFALRLAFGYIGSPKTSFSSNSRRSSSVF